MAKKKTTKKAGTKAKSRSPAKKAKKAGKAVTKKKSPKKAASKKTAKRPKVSKPKTTNNTKSKNQMEVIHMSQLVQKQPSLAKVMDSRDSLLHWCTVYLKTMVDPESNTFKAKRGDIQRFLGFFHGKAKSFDCDKWTPSITKAYVRWLPKQKPRARRGSKPTAAWLRALVLATWTLCDTQLAGFIGSESS